MTSPDPCAETVRLVEDVIVQAEAHARWPIQNINELRAAKSALLAHVAGRDQALERSRGMVIQWEKWHIEVKQQLARAELDRDNARRLANTLATSLKLVLPYPDVLPVRSDFPLGSQVIPEEKAE